MVLSFCVECKTHEEFFPSPRETGPSPSYKGHSPQTQLDAMTGVCGRDMQRKKSSQQYWMPLPSGWWFYPSWKILKNHGVRQWEGWHPICEMENHGSHVWNQQPAIDKCWDDLILYFWGVPGSCQQKIRWKIGIWHPVEVPRPQIKRSYAHKGMTKGREGSQERRR